MLEKSRVKDARNIEIHIPVEFLENKMPNGQRQKVLVTRFT